ncbi:MAG: hypothetical protein ACRCST_11315 [Turicibacter sp.]
MPKFQIITWQTGVVTSSPATVNQVLYTVQLPKDEFNVAKSLFKTYIEIRKTSYSNRENNNPVLYYDSKQQVFYKPSDVHVKQLNVKLLDYIYADLKYDGDLKINRSLVPIFFRKQKFTFDQLSRRDRNQTLQYPALLKSYLEHLYHTGKLELPYDPINNRIMTLENVLYDINFIIQYLTPEQLKLFMTWLDDKYHLFINPDSLIFQIKQMN